jgi:hypothetical protein
MIQRLILSSVLILTSSGVGTGLQTKLRALKGGYTGPRSIGAYSINQDIKEKDFLKLLGTKPTGAEVYCFADKANGVYLNAVVDHDQSHRIASVTISTFHNCQHLRVTQVTLDPKQWLTPEGIGLGSTKHEALAAYGPPAARPGPPLNNPELIIRGQKLEDKSSIDLGDSTFLYSCLAEKNCSDDLRATRMGFRHNQLIWLTMSNSE